MELCRFCGGAHMSTCPAIGDDNVVPEEILSRLSFEEYCRSKYAFGYWEFFMTSQGVIYYKDPEIQDLWRSWKDWKRAAEEALKQVIGSKIDIDR